MSSGSVAIPTMVVGRDLRPLLSRTRTRTALIATSDASLRERLRLSLTALRWKVLEAPCGAECWVASQGYAIEALLIDAWLPDLDVNEFLADFHREHPNVDLMMTDGAPAKGSSRSPYHQELLYALRRSQETDTAIWNTARPMPVSDDARSVEVSGLPSVHSSLLGAIVGDARPTGTSRPRDPYSDQTIQKNHAQTGDQLSQMLVPCAPPREIAAPLKLVPTDSACTTISASSRMQPKVEPIPGLIGAADLMIEVSRRIRLVAARSTSVLIQGPTGSGKELVADAVHRLSNRAKKPLIAINCAAIPEALLEAELFGHTRGAFTGAVQGRIGRIEAADGGTLFLDEIGEMPLALQSKLLRFFESGELQRIGDNETVKVDVRLIAATHQSLADEVQKGAFRADLYYRLAVFLIRTPALCDHMEDLPMLAAHFISKMGRTAPVKRIDAPAMAKLQLHSWPGNVRELEHVLERASILAGDDPLISCSEIDFG